jgi:hypothetical protein
MIGEEVYGLGFMIESIRRYDVVKRLRLRCFKRQVPYACQLRTYYRVCTYAFLLVACKV